MPCCWYKPTRLYKQCTNGLLSTVLKFRVVDPTILTKDAKKREWKAATNAKKTQPSGQKRKVPDAPDDTAVESDEMETEEREGKKRKKRNLNASAGVLFHIQIRAQ